MSEQTLREEYLRRNAELDALRAEAKRRGIDLSDDVAGITDTGNKSLDDLLDRLHRGEGDIIYRTSDALDGIEIGPRKITVIGAPPGAGKTALTMQFVFGHLQNDPTARAVVANAEMPFDVLVRREITRRAGVPSRALRFADLTPKQMDAVEQSASEIRPLVERIDVMQPPFDCLRLHEACEGKNCLVVVDYLQKFASGDDARVAVNSVMNTLRIVAHGGCGILALSATSRGSGKQGGHDSKSLSMSSFKESGEIEFNADAAYLLRDDGPVDEADQRVRKINLDCVKNRHGERESMNLVFDMPSMRFSRQEPERFSELDEYAGDDHGFSFGGGQ